MLYVGLTVHQFLVEMARPEGNVKFPSCDAYFDTIQAKKKLPLALQESLTAAFAQIPVSSFPDVPSGRGTPRCKRNLLNLLFLSHILALLLICL